MPILASRETQYITPLNYAMSLCLYMPLYHVQWHTFLSVNSQYFEIAPFLICSFGPLVSLHDRWPCLYSAVILPVPPPHLKQNCRHLSHQDTLYYFMTTASPTEDPDTVGLITRSPIFVLYFEMVWWPFGSSYSGAIVEAPDTRLLISGGGGTTLRRGRKDFCFVQFVLVMGDIRYDALKMCCQRTITSWLPRIISISLAVNKQ